MRKIISILPALFLIISLNAQSPNSFKYQAIVRDKSGNLITNKIVNIQISILQANISGTVVYSEKHYPTSSKFGLVNFEIGKGTIISGIFSSIDWTNGPYFVSIDVNGNVLGKSQLLSVPYAKYAEKSGNAFSGNYNDLINKPAPYDGSWASITGKPNFSNVVLTGSYHDLVDKPLFDGTWNFLIGKPNFSSVSISGKYNDLVNQPTLFSGNYNDLINKPNFYDGTWISLSGKPNFSVLATSGSYTDLSNKPGLFSGSYIDLLNKPAIFDGTWGSITGKETFSTVAATGNYSDLANLPSIFSGNYTDLSNLPFLFSGNYNDLTNKPTILSSTWDLLPGKPTFSVLAISGSFNDLSKKPLLFDGNYNKLINTPVLFDGTWNMLIGKPNFSTVLISGSYNDLLDKPILFDGNYNNLSNMPVLFDGTWGSLTGKEALATISTTGSYLDLKSLPVLFSGSYIDLLNKPPMFTGNYNDLSNKPTIINWTWDLLTGKPIFSAISTSGNYNDLLNKPTLFSGNYTDLTNPPAIVNWTWDLLSGKPTFSLVATSGNYNDLLNKPSNLFSGNYIDLSNKPNLFDGTWTSLTGKPIFANVFATGSYLDLINRPTLFSGNYSDLLNQPILFSGDYNDLTNKPILFDKTWTSLVGKPSFSAVALSGSYNDLLNKPNLFNGTWSSLTGQPTTLADYGITDAMSKSHVANGITSTQINNWNTAFGWGDYSTKGYAIASDFYSKSELLTNAASLVHWANITNKPSTISGYGISDFMFTSPSNNQLLQYSNGKWINWTPTYGNQQLGLAGTTLTITGAGGNTAQFTNWDTNSSDDVTLSGTQTITGDKIFSGTTTTSGTIMATNGLNAVNNKITNVKDPVNASDIASKLYIDVLKAQLAALQARYDIILTHMAMAVTDYDGYVYKTVTIGTQVWMAENLRTTHYMNGDPIATTYPVNLNISDTQIYPEPRYTWPVFGDSANIPEFGRLYTWWAANDSRQVCPSGWHVPSLDEFNVLLATAGGETAGTNLKDAGSTHWTSANTGTNSTGFSWVGNGNRYPDHFGVFKTYGCIHTSTTSVYNSAIPYHFHARTEYTSVPIDSALYHPKSMGSAVRCLKN